MMALAVCKEEREKIETYQFHTKKVRQLNPNYMGSRILPATSIKNTFGKVDDILFNGLFEKLPHLFTLIVSYLHCLHPSRFSIYFSQFNFLLKTENKSLSVHQHWWRPPLNRQALL